MPATAKELNISKSYYTLEHGFTFPARAYITEVLGCVPSNIELDGKYLPEVVEFLQKNGSLVSSDTSSKSAEYCFLYKSCFVQVERKDESWIKGEKAKNFYHVSLVAPTGTRFPIKDFERFHKNEEGTKISLFIKDGYGEYTFEPLVITNPANQRIDLNYGAAFVGIDNEIRSRLEQDSSGLYMFHGPPGTGKSSYIKHLAQKVGREFIYIPTAMLETFTTDPACLQILTGKPRAVLVLEDAEKIIAKRHGDNADGTALSSLLNLSDGILSDMLNISVVVTYNCSTDDIDRALLRKGRLQAEYRFPLLSPDASRTLASHIGHDPAEVAKINQSMSLADIYNLCKQVEFGAPKEEKSIGFTNG